MISLASLSSSGPISIGSLSLGPCSKSCSLHAVIEFLLSGGKLRHQSLEFFVLLEVEAADVLANVSYQDACLVEELVLSLSCHRKHPRLNQVGCHALRLHELMEGFPRVEFLCFEFAPVFNYLLTCHFLRLMS